MDESLKGGVFIEEKCTRCGICFSECPVMGLSKGDAREEIVSLISGKPTRKVIGKCQTCFACDHNCPRQANPSALILKRFNEKYEKNGFPIRAKYFCPEEKTNFRSFVMRFIPSDEKSMIEKWKSRSPSEEILYPGCNIITASFITRTKALEGMDIRGSLDLCCGETFYRMGCFDEAKAAGIRLASFFKEIGAKRVNVLCTAGCNMMMNVLPSLGVKMEVEVIPYLPVILEKLESGELEIKKKLRGTATIQESCYGRQFGDEYMDVPRRILNLLGVEVLEEKKNRNCAVCCGIAGGFPPDSGYHIYDVTKATIKSLLRARATRADRVVTYCAGCLQMLCVGKLVFPLRMPVYHILEMISEALGEENRHPVKVRSLAFLAGTMRYQLPITLSKKRYKIPEIS